MSNLGYHEVRLIDDKKRTVLWQTLSRYFQRYVPKDSTVIDFGAGYCGFINGISAKRKIAFDQWDGIAEFAGLDVETIIGSFSALRQLGDDAADVVFASNVFEHFERRELAEVLQCLRRILKPNGVLIVVQPNFYYSYRRYFDDYTHESIWTHVSLADFLNLNGFLPKVIRPAFLPLTVKSKFPVIPTLIKAYLMSPFKPFAGQMLLVATRK